MSSILLTCRNKESAHKHYVAALRAGGWVGAVDLVSPGDPVPSLEGYSGLLLLGGADIHPRHWDPAEPVHGTVELDEGRDALELPLVREAWQRHIPILGVCRGAQVLNVALGGSLHQDIPSRFGVEATLHQRGTPEQPELAHTVAVEPGSALAGLLGSLDPEVNSRHHQAVRRIAPGLKAVAWHPGTRDVEGALVEAVESLDPERFAVGVQWHPENLVGLSGEAGRAALNLFRSFVERVGASAINPEGVGPG